MKKYLLTSLATGLLVVGMAGFASADTATFDVEPQTGDHVTLGGDLYWGDVGGGHASLGNYFTEGLVNFATPTYLNDFQLNALPRENYVPSSFQNMVIGDVYWSVYDDSGNMITSGTADLTGYTNWDPASWLTVSVEEAMVSQLKLEVEHTGTPFGGPHSGFWPSIDNIRYNESNSNPVPEPATLLFFGAGLAGLAGTMRRRK